MMKNEKPGGHGDRSVAVGVLDMALWDAAAKLAGKPLWKLLADRYRGGEADDNAWIYAAGGYYYPGKGEAALVEEMQRYLDLGYSVVKMKIGGAPGTPLRAALKEDVGRIEAVLKLLGGDGSRLCVDVNGRFGLHAALAYGAALEPYKLRWYEEPLDPLDYATHATLAEHYSGPLATGENLFSMLDARNLIRHGGLRADRDILQFDPALSYGLVEYLRTLAMLQEHGWSPRRCVPHGGHQFALNIAIGLGLGGNESYPEVFAPFGGFADATPGRGQPHPHAGRPGHRLRAEGQSLGRAEGRLALRQIDDAGEAGLGPEGELAAGWHSRPAPKSRHAPAAPPARSCRSRSRPAARSPSAKPAATTSCCGWQATAMHSTPSPPASSVGALPIGPPPKKGQITTLSAPLVASQRPRAVKAMDARLRRDSRTSACAGCRPAASHAAHSPASRSPHGCRPG